MAIPTPLKLTLMLCLATVPCLADSVTLQNQNFPSIVVEARIGPDQQHVEKAQPAPGPNPRTLSKGGSWQIDCPRGQFVMYRSHEPANDWSDWTAAFCSGDTSVRISDGGRLRFGVRVERSSDCVGYVPMICSDVLREETHNGCKLHENSPFPVLDCHDHLFPCSQMQCSDV